MAKIEQLPLDLSSVRDSALVELERLTELIADLTPAEWLIPSAAARWSVGEVVAHVNFFLGMYNGLLARLLVGDPLGRAAATLDRLALSAMPRAMLIFNAVNAAIPRGAAIRRTSEARQTRFIKRARRTRELLQRGAADDYLSSGKEKDGAHLLSFYLAIAVNELAIHGWDMESRIRTDAVLSDSARFVLPWFYWSATELMLRLPKGINGTVQVLLSEPASAMWWSITAGSADSGRDMVSQPDVTIRASSGRYVLGVAGRLKPIEVLDSPTAVDGDRALAARFLSAWHII